MYVSVQGVRKPMQMCDVRETIRNVPNGPTDFHGFVIRKTKAAKTAYQQTSARQVGLSYFSASHR